MSSAQAQLAPSPRTRSGAGELIWRVALLSACLVLVYAHVLMALVRQWWDEPDYSHGFLVPLCCLWLLWQRRERLEAAETKPSASGLAIIIFSFGVLLMGSLAAELFLQRISLIGVLLGLVVWLWGWPKARQAAFALLFLILMIPLPRLVYFQVVFPLQMVATRLATAVLHRINLFPVLREGNILILPSTRLEVAEACSGLRSLFSLLTIAALYAYLGEKKNWKRVVLCLLVVPIAVVGNAGRVVFAAISAELAGVSAAEGWAHFASGLFLFLFSTMLLLLCHALINEVERRWKRLRRAR